MSKPFKLQIKKLKFIVKHWEDFKTKPKKTEQLFKDTFKCVFFSIDAGLCDNVSLSTLVEDEFKNDLLKEEIFKSFPKYSGNEVFPLSSFEKYSSMKNFTETPERLELARHCIEFLKKERKKNKYKVK